MRYFGFGKSEFTPTPGPSSAEEESSYFQRHPPRRAAQAPPAPRGRGWGPPPSGRYRVRDEQRTEVDEKLDKLQKLIEAKRAARSGFLARHRAELAKQAAYTRDVERKAVKGGSYTTEAEQIMGGQTGYGEFGYRGLGSVELEQAIADVTAASASIKKLAKDVKAGIVPRSDLEIAAKDLESKAGKVIALKKQAGLSGFGEGKSQAPLILGVLAFVAAMFVFLPK